MCLWGSVCMASLTAGLSAMRSPSTGSAKMAGGGATLSRGLSLPFCDPVCGLDLLSSGRTSASWHFFKLICSNYCFSGFSLKKSDVSRLEIFSFFLYVLSHLRCSGLCFFGD